jgi:hypothetical protein
MPVYSIAQHNVLFIHIPKTAGSAIDEQLSLHGPSVFSQNIGSNCNILNPRHQPAECLQNTFFPSMLDYSFTVVRHPIAKLISEYRYQRRKRGLHLSRLRFAGFDLWLQNALSRVEKDPSYKDNHFRRQVDYPCFDCEIFRYEDGLYKVMQSVSRRTGQNITYKGNKKNVSPKRQVLISSNSIELIIQYYADDFHQFGYEKTLPPIEGVALKS